MKVARSNNMRPLKFEVPPATERALQLRQRAGCQTSKLASQPTMATLQSDHTAREAGKEMKAEEETESSKNDGAIGQVGTPHPPKMEAEEDDVAEDGMEYLVEFSENELREAGSKGPGQPSTR